MKSKLTAKQQRFIEAYTGNATEAAKVAGYSEKSAEKIGRDLLRNPTVAEAIRARESQAIKPLIASRQKRQEFWSMTMQDTAEDMRNRLKASELLGKSEGDFLSKVETTGKDGQPLIINVVRFSDMADEEEVTGDAS